MIVSGPAAGHKAAREDPATGPWGIAGARQRAGCLHRPGGSPRALGHSPPPPDADKENDCARLAVRKGHAAAANPHLLSVPLGPGRCAEEPPSGSGPLGPSRRRLPVQRFTGFVPGSPPPGQDADGAGAGAPPVALDVDSLVTLDVDSERLYII